MYFGLMSNNLQIILDNLKSRLDREGAGLDPPFLYLDPEGARHLYEQLTGLGHAPGIRFTYPEGGGAGSYTVSAAPDAGNEAPLPLLFESMWPLIKNQVRHVDRPEAMPVAVHQYAHIRGLMQTTRFPDGRLNPEIVFAGLRGLLFFTENYFSSLMRPFLGHDRFHTLSCNVKAVVYVHGPLRKTIFYHQTYGDNMEHDWLPLVPVAIIRLDEKEESAFHL